MKTRIRAALVAALLAAPLAGCSTTATSTHGTDPVTTSTASFWDRDGNPRSLPNSDYAVLKGDSSRRMLELGRENFAQQNYGLSERYFRQAVEARTDSASAWAGLAASYDHLGKFEDADRAYSQLMQLKKDDARVLNNLGYSHLLRGDYQKARTLFNRAQTIDPALEQVQGNLHLLEKVINS